MAANTNETSKAITVVGKIMSTGNRRFISVPADYRSLIDSLDTKRVLVQMTPLA